MQRIQIYIFLFLWKTFFHILRSHMSSSHLYIKPTQQTTQARTMTPKTVAAVPAGEPPEAEMGLHLTVQTKINGSNTLISFIHSPTATLTLALVMARLTSLVSETLRQNTPVSLKNWRRMSWQSGEGEAALQMVCTGVIQSASETTVQTSLGRLKERMDERKDVFT